MQLCRKKVISDIYDDIKVVAQHHPASKSTDGYFKSYKNGKCGLVHETGKQILPPIFDDCFGLCWAGKESCNPEYRFAIVTNNDKKGLYNELGNEVLPIKYDSMRFVHPDSFNAKNIRVRGKIGDEKEIDLIEYESAEKGLFGNKRNRKNSFFQIDRHLDGMQDRTHKTKWGIVMMTSTLYLTVIHQHTGT